MSLDESGLAPAPASDAAGVTTPPTASTEPGAWREALPESVRVWQETAQAQSPEHFWRQMEDMRSHVGNSVRPPGPDAPPEAQQEFYAKLLEKAPGLMAKPDRDNAEAMTAFHAARGVPDKPENYIRPQIEGAPAMDVEVDQSLAELAHRNNFDPGQYSALVEAAANHNMAVAHAQAESNAAQQAAMKQEWGFTFDNKMEAVGGMLQQFGFSDNTIDNLQSGMMGVQDTKALHAMLSQLTGEGAIMASQPGNAPAGLTPNEALLQIREVMSRPDYNHHDRTVRQPLIEKVQELQKYANPNAEFSIEGLRRGVTAGP